MVEKKSEARLAKTFFIVVFPVFSQSAFGLSGQWFAQTNRIEQMSFSARSAAR
jgi:hypothetical protein